MNNLFFYFSIKLSFPYGVFYYFFLKYYVINISLLPIFNSFVDNVFFNYFFDIISFVNIFIFEFLFIFSFLIGVFDFFVLVFSF